MRVIDAVYQRAGRKAAKNDRMNSTNARAGQDGNRQFWHHAHIQRNTVALLHPDAAQHVGKALHLIEQLLKGKLADLAGFAFPQDGRLVAAPALHLQVQAVIGEVHFAADKPLRPRLIPFQHLRPRLEPVQFVRSRRPEFFRVFD